MEEAQGCVEKLVLIDCVLHGTIKASSGDEPRGPSGTVCLRAVLWPPNREYIKSQVSGVHPPPPTRYVAIQVLTCLG